MTSVLKRFDGLSLAIKLTIGFGTLIGLMLASLALTMAGHQRGQAQVDAYFDRDDRISDLAMSSRAAMESARRYEKEFLLKVDVFSYEEARSRYATLVRAQLDQVRENLATIRTLTRSNSIAADTRRIEAAVLHYDTSFHRVVELRGRLGSFDSGMGQTLRSHAHALELTVAGHDTLLVDLLTMRRNEKNFVMRGQQSFVTGFGTSAEQLRVHLRDSRLDAAHRAAAVEQAILYQRAFESYVALRADIDAGTIDYLQAVHKIEPDLEHLRQQADLVRDQTQANVIALNRQLTWLLVLSAITAVALGVLIARYVVRHAHRAVASCVDFAGRLAQGDWSARLPAGSGDNEFATLGAALNSMADKLLVSHQREHARTNELVRLNRTMRMMSLCSEAMVQARDETELLQAVCRHIADSGSYALAWVGLARRDARHSVEAVALGGDAADFVRTLALSWGPDTRRRGACGHAIAEQRAILVNELATDAVFSPCYEQAKKHGFAACLALPLRGKDGVLGGLSIYTREAGGFDEAEVRLLQELADDLAFGLVSMREAGRRESAERALDYETKHDPSTGLANRILFGERLLQSTLQAARNGQQVAVLALALDRFKNIKDSLGHDTSTALLQHVARILTNTLGYGATIARLAGEEFAVSVHGLDNPDDLLALVRSLLAACSEPMDTDAGAVHTTASIGISLFPKDGTLPGNLLGCASAALASAQAMGPGRFHFFAPEMNDRSRKMFALESDLRRALERQELRVYYQPRANLASGELAGAEALLRWQHPERGLVPPGDFIPLAEASGLIVPIGAWVIDEVCRQQRAWADAGLALTPVAVNLSARQFQQENLVNVISKALADHHLDASHLELEITESMLMENIDDALATLKAFKALGIKLSLDDFGTGHSSLARLRHLPIDHLKIDQSFVRNLINDPGDAAVCHAIIDLAHNLHMTVIAEGVETEGQANYLRQNRCDEMQGYLFARPLPAPDFETILAARSGLAMPGAASLNGRTLLMLDDEPNILSALKRLFRPDGYTILTATNAHDAFDLLSVNEVQVILSDQRMPEMNGTEFLSRVRDLYPDTVRIVLSGYTDLASVTEAINRGSIYKFLTKPWSDEALRSDVRQAFRLHENEKGRATAAQ